MGLQEEMDGEAVAAFLRDEAPALDFVVGGIHVRPHLFAQVAEAISQGYITVSRSRGAGIYHADEDRLAVSLGGHGDGWKELALHESIHAYCDIHSMRNDYLWEEATAYLAQTTYRFLRHSWWDNDWRGDWTADMRLLSAAASVARANGLDHSSGVTLSRADIQLVRDAVAAHPAYGAAPCAEDGVSSGHLWNYTPSSGLAS
ncbi:MAG: hypothetical protein U0271_16245 [Polyangiaceae bacterium]